MNAEKDTHGMVRRIMGTIKYLTIATADAAGRPWVSPVWYAAASPTELLWVSDPQSRHSRNIAVRGHIGIVIYDSNVPIGGAEGVYMVAVARQLGGADLGHAITMYSERSQEEGGPAWTISSVSAPADARLYRATVTSMWVLGIVDTPIPVVLEGFGGPEA